MKTAIVIPTFNEAENVNKMIDALLKLGIENLNILIVDDASPDGTGLLADKAAEKFPGKVFVIHRSGPRGLGRAYIDGFKWALNNKVDTIIQMDCDFSHSPEYIPLFLDKIRYYDVVIGSRYIKGGKTDEKWEWHRLLLSWWANSVYTRLILGSHIHDITGGFKCWRRRVLEEIGLENIESQGYIFQVEMGYLAEKLGFETLEIPIYFAERILGTSKMNMKIKIEAAIRLWDIRRRHIHVKKLGSTTPKVVENN
jgi:dolichol-phosphate mannosyltransferase